MPIRWSALKVSQSLDEIQRLLHEAEIPLRECQAKASETADLPNLAGYMSERMMRLADITDNFIEGMQSRIKSMRDDIPQKELAREQKRFEQWLALCDGDEQKAKEAMTSFL